MGRTDRASRHVGATPARVYAALVDPAALVEWLPPSGSTGTFERFDPRPGDPYRLVLTFDPASGARGKATTDTDVVEATFVELVPDRRVVQRVEFESDDPTFRGTMTMTWQATPTEGGTLVEIIADGVPPGISAEDHAAGLTSSLDNLAAFLAR